MGCLWIVNGLLVVNGSNDGFDLKKRILVNLRVSLHAWDRCSIVPSVGQGIVREHGEEAEEGNLLEHLGRFWAEIKATFMGNDGNIYGGFLRRGYHEIIHLNRIFHYTQTSFCFQPSTLPRSIFPLDYRV